MFGTQNLWLFVTSAVLLALTPGQDTLYILGRSMAQGRRAGLISVLGILTGVLVHTVAAAFGLSAILATSPRMFLIVKMAGAAYLAYLGLRMLLHRSSDGAQIITFDRESAWAIYRAGFLTNILNPKVALFFMAFLPQFVAPTAQFRIAAFLFLGAVFIAIGTAWSLLLAWFGSAFSRRFRENPAAGSRLTRASGALFVGLGVKLAVTR